MRAKPPASGNPLPGPRLPSVTLIGLGNWGTVLARALDDAGVAIREIVTRSTPRNRTGARNRRHARATTLARATLNADLLWICTPDAAIASVADQLAVALARRARRQLPVIFHASGALPSAALVALQQLGASVASVHPLMTFPHAARNSASTPRPLAGVPFAIEGDARAGRMARRLVCALGGEPFTLAAKDKPLYHAFGTFASPLLVALLQAAVETATAAGYTPQQARRRMRPIVERTVLNFFENGAGKSFSGPIARGDAATVARHLDALHKSPALLSAYRELARFALHSLPARNKKQMEQLLQHPADNFYKTP